MKKDAHYYAVLAFARAVGFQKDAAQIIAYSSQFVDDSKINHIIIKGNSDNIEHNTIDNKPAFFNMATCHSYFKIKTFNFSAMTNNTCAFHFVPGCDGESFVKKLRCKQKDNEVISKILKEAKNENNLVKFGMVLHPFADTFSHQGFSGLLSKVNDIRDVKTKTIIVGVITHKISKVLKWLYKSKFDNLLDSGMPAYGHGQAMENPDLPYLKWSYKYDYSDQFSESIKTSQNDNPARFRNAFQMVKKHLEDYLEKHPEFKDGNLNFQKFEKLYNTLLKSGSDKKRIKNWQRAFIELGLFNESDIAFQYDENLWLKKAFSNFHKKKFNEREVENAVLSDNFGKSNWYKFYQAVKWYKMKFFTFCEEKGLKIPNEYLKVD